jgi:colanic acid biosynthesis protein WcaH
MSEFTAKQDRIPDDDWKTIVQNVPIVSVDVVVKSADGVVLGKRQNAPARGEWFVPGGRVYKHERLDDAVHRIVDEELSVDVRIVERLGAYEHLYHDAELTAAAGKHYLANGFIVETDQKIDEIRFDDQHCDVKAFEPDKLPEDLHKYTAAYLHDSTTLSYANDELSDSSPISES